MYIGLTNLGLNSNQSSSGTFNGAQLQQFHTRASAAYFLDSSLSVNLFRYSQPSVINWTIAGLTKVSTTAIAPDGSLSATELFYSHQFDNLTAALSAMPSVPLIAGNTYTLSYWARRDSGSNALSNYSDNGFPLGSNFTPTSTWTRYSSTFVWPAGAAQVVIMQDRNTSGFTNCQVWGVQVEPGAVMGAYRPTSGSEATRLTTYAANVLRVVPAPDGIVGALREVSATNLQLQSQTIGTAPWASGGGPVTFVANAGIAPDGSSTATYVSNTAGVSSFATGNVGTLSNSTTYTRSIYAKSVSGTGILALEYFDGSANNECTFDVINGIVTLTGSGMTSRIESVGNGWYRCSITAVTGATGIPTMQVHYIGAYGSTATPTTLALWGAQLEANSFPTSYIPTTSAAVSRSRDEILDPIAVGAGAPFSMSMDFCSPYQATSATRLTSGNSFGVSIDSIRTVSLFNGTSSVVTANTYTLNNRGKAAFSSDGTGRSVCLNAGTVATDANLSGAITSLYLGQNATGSDSFAGVVYFHSYQRATTRWSNAQLQTITT